MPLTFACARDLAAYPPRFLWMFDYDYVLVPGTGRPWPLTTIYGNRYEYGPLLWVLGLFGDGARSPRSPSSSRAARDGGRQRRRRRRRRAAAAARPRLRARRRVRRGARRRHRRRPVDAERRRAVAVAVAVADSGGADAGARSCCVARSVRFGALVPLAVVAMLYGAFLLDRYLPDLGPHWSQKHVIAVVLRASQRPRRAAHRLQPLLARRELLHAQRGLFAVRARPKNGPGSSRTICDPGLWFQQHKGTRIFILLERHRLEQVRGILPVGSRQDVKIVDDSNNKLFLVEVRI